MNITSNKEVAYNEGMMLNREQGYSREMCMQKMKTL